MMFCSKCGAQLPDDSKFCPACGAAVEAPEAPKAEEAPKATPEVKETPEATATPAVSGSKKFGPAPLGVMKTFGAKNAFRLPNIAGFVMLGITAIVFFLSTMNLWRANVVNPYTGQKLKYAYTIFEDNLFDLSALLGFAKIFMILSLIFALACFAYFFIDFTKLIGDKIPQKLFDFLPLAYFGLVAVSLFFTFIGSLSVTDVGVKCGPTFGWFLTFLFCAGGVVFTIMPGLLDTIVGKIYKK